jgi:hypothetical protein
VVLWRKHCRVRRRADHDHRRFLGSRQELFLGEAEDAAEIISLNQTVTVPAGTYSRCLQTEDFTPIDPDNTEFKYYAPGIGNVLTINPETGKRVELISVTHN